MKLTAAVLLSLSFLFGVCSVVSAQDEVLMLEGGVIVEERTLVPLRSILEALGATIGWDGETETVTSTKEGKTIVLQINNKVAHVDGSRVELDVPPKLIDSATMIPLRFVSEALGAQVHWDSASNVAKIKVDQKIIHILVKTDAIEYLWTSSPIVATTSGLPSKDKDGNVSWVFTNSNSNHKDSYVIYRKDGKLLSQQKGTIKLYGFWKVLPAADGVFAIGRSDLQRVSSNGKVIWSKTFGEPFDVVQGASGNLFVTYNSNLYEINSDTGETISTYFIGSHDASMFDPARETFYVFQREKLYAVKNNKTIWSQPAPENYEIFQPELITPSGHVVAASRSKNGTEDVVQVYSPDGEPLWKYTLKDGNLLSYGGGLTNDQDDILITYYDRDYRNFYVLFDVTGEIISTSSLDDYSTASSTPILHLSNERELFVLHEGWNLDDSTTTYHIMKLNQEGKKIAESELSNEIFYHDKTAPYLMERIPGEHHGGYSYSLTLKYYKLK